MQGTQKIHSQEYIVVIGSILGREQNGFNIIDSPNGGFSYRLPATLWYLKRDNRNVNPYAIFRQTDGRTTDRDYVIISNEIQTNVVYDFLAN